MIPTEPNLLDQAALDWALRLSTGPLTPAEEQAFAGWIEEDPANESRLHSYTQVYGQLSRTVPRMAAAGTLRDPRQKPLRPSPALFRRLAWGTAAAAAVALSTLWFVHRPEHLTTTVAHRQSVTLSDGSVVDLNAQTSLEARLRGAERHVVLAQGEAYFQVAKDGRPFLVDTPAGSVRVTGTAFNVRTVSADQLEVTVLEGAVVVSAGTNIQSLAPQDQLKFERGEARVDPLSVDSAREVILWREGRIAFRAEPLVQAAARFTRYHGRKIEVAPEIAALELGGRFRLDDLNAFLDAVEAALPVRALRSGDPVRLVPRSH